MSALRLMRESDLAQVLAWRNHPEIARYMLQPGEITPEEHAAWFDRNQNNPARHLLLYEDQGQGCGFMQLALNAQYKNLDWGFYAAPDAPKGTGRRMGEQALAYAFDELKAHKLCGQVLSSNPRSQQFHQRLGFQLEGVLRQQHVIAGEYLDVHCFGLLADEWRSAR